MSDQLIIDSVPYGSQETHGLSQTYAEVDGGKSHRRMADGTLNTQCFWSKIKTTISGNAWIPPGMDALDHASSYVVECLVPRTISSDGLTITIPAGRRSDIALDYTAIVDDKCVPATASIATNLVTFTAPVGAQAYRVSYVPKLTMRLVNKSNSGNVWGAIWDWSLEFEEI